jgi:D-alanyl-D-alanine carboxypeptidase
MRNPTFAKIVATPSYVARGKATYTLQNGNRFLTQYEGADGVKTGFTENAKQSFVASVTLNGQRVFVGLIQSDDRYRDARTLFDFSFRNFVWLKFALPNSPFYSLPAPDGSFRKLKVLDDQTEPLARWQIPYLRSFVTVQENDPSQNVETTEADSYFGSGNFYFGADLVGVLAVE